MPRAKKLVCFYCNKKSNLSYDGNITEWPCATCEAVNYLDENGEITDPPVATYDTSPKPDLSFRTTRETIPISDSNPFCQTCLHNQQVLLSNLREYPIEPEATFKEQREYYKFRNNLEKLYPQVCEDCEPRVLERMTAAKKTAQADFLGRLLDRTRTRRAATRPTYSFVDIILFLTKWLWYLGIAGQLLWNIMGLLEIYTVTQPAENRLPYLDLVAEFSQPLITLATSKTWARYSLHCSLFSVWWNPKYKEAHKGFMNHVSGYADWYKLQLLHIVIRLFFYYTMGSGVFSDLHAPATAGAHLMVPIFVALLAFRSKRALKVDMTPLWTPTTPEEFKRHVGPSPSSSRRSSQDSGQGSTAGLIGILNEIGKTPTKLGPQIAPPSAYLEEAARRKRSQSPQPPTARSPPFPTKNPSPPYTKGMYKKLTIGKPSDSPPLFSNNKDSGIFPSLDSYGKGSSYTATGESSYGSIPSLNSHNSFTPYSLHNSYTNGNSTPSSFSTGNGYMPTGAPSYAQQLYTQNGDEEMEWTPSLPQTQARAFNPARKPYLFDQPLGGTQPSPFYGKLPEAPISPAHRLRNPPNQARLRVSSPQEKENFFRSVTGRNADFDQTNGVTGSKAKTEMNITQQKFFPPTPPSEEANLLSDLLTSFSLSAETETPIEHGKPSKTHHVWAVVALLLGLFFWNSSTSSENPLAIMATIMIGCVGIGMRTMLDSAVFLRAAKGGLLSNTVRACLGGLELAGAGYVLFQTLASNGDFEKCSAMGTLIIGAMLAHEMWVTLFGC
ncbi:uncharacterized protein PAC_09491 [Phialocephala subalpina]|uniref:Ima1 N-terminal domain-containing protein n=1 Tax=Phialocephala subalpina TaxID=576137 RepID=A0A1L7X3N3_9HELO|nr:uncharacterized protein PAC_09491 [Phialocephala subalpina]